MVVIVTSESGVQSNCSLAERTFGECAGFTLRTQLAVTQPGNVGSTSSRLPHSKSVFSGSIFMSEKTLFWLADSFSASLAVAEMVC